MLSLHLHQRNQVSFQSYLAVFCRCRIVVEVNPATERAALAQCDIAVTFAPKLFTESLKDQILKRLWTFKLWSVGKSTCKTLDFFFVLNNFHYFSPLSKTGHMTPPLIAIGFLMKTGHPTNVAWCLPHFSPSTRACHAQKQATRPASQQASNNLAALKVESSINQDCVGGKKKQKHFTELLSPHKRWPSDSCQISVRQPEQHHLYLSSAWRYGVAAFHRRNNRGNG